MSIRSFVHGGSRGKLLLETSGAPPYPEPYPIRIYDIDDPTHIGVEYPGKDRQAQPIIWWAERLRRAGVTVVPAPAAPTGEMPQQEPPQPAQPLRRRGMPAVVVPETTPAAPAPLLRRRGNGS